MGGMLKTKDILVLAAFFGLLTGLGEGAGLHSFQQFGWLTWAMAQMGVSAGILWISPLFDLILFVAAGLFAALLLPLTPLRWRFQVCMFLFAFLLFLDWLLLVDRIRDLGSILLAAGLASVLARWAAPREESVLRVSRKCVPALAALAVLAFAVVEGGALWKERTEAAHLAPAAARTPNVLVIVVDTLRADHLSSYGYSRTTSPHIDELAKQGVLFERTFSSSSWTLPSHASMLTGRYPHDHGATMVRLEPGPPTLGEALIERGYRTAAFSANTIYFSQMRGFGRGFHHFEDIFCSTADRAVRTVYGRMIYRYVLRALGYENIPARKSAGDINRALLRWLEPQPQRPFFAFLNYMDTHDPYLPPKPYRGRFSKLASPGGRVNEFIGRHRPKLTPEQLQGEIDAYDGAIAYVDDEIGKLMEELKKRNLAENTLVVITSDHGESFGEHGLFTHRNALYRNLIHVPLVFYWPGHVPAGMRIGAPVSQTFLAATVMEITGGNQRQTFPGVSLAEFWKNASTHTDTPLPIAELNQMPFEGMKPAPAYYGAMQSAVSPAWHYIHNDALDAELFSWDQDSEEKNNLAKTPEGQKALAELLARLKQEQVQMGAQTKSSSHDHGN